MPQFAVADLVRTTEYYRDVLGFQIAGYWDGERVSLVPDSPPDRLELHDGGIKLRDANLNIRVLATRHDLQLDRGIVIAQTPQGGRSVEIAAL